MAARQKFNALANNDEGLAKWAKDEFQNSDDVRAIRVVLNELELIAIAIQRGIIDDTTYRRFFKSGTIKTWERAESYVKARRARTGNQALYHEVEQLAQWYKGKGKMPRRFWSVRQII